MPGHDGVFVAGDWVGPVGLLSDATAASAVSAAHEARGSLGPRRRSPGHADHEWTTPTSSELDVFEAERPRLLGLAYRILGSAVDAEDVVQEAWVRWSSAEDIERPAAWLTTVVSRLALDAWRAQQRKREDYVGPWLPEPVAIEPGPAERAELADSLTFGFLVLLDELTPDGAGRVPPRRCVRRAVRRHRFDGREVRGGVPSDRESSPAPVAGVQAHETESLVCSARRGLAASGRERGCRRDDGVARS